MNAYATERAPPEPLVLDAARAVAQLRDEALFLIDTQGRIASWNEGVGAILGWAQAEWIGQPVSVIFTPGDVALGVPDAEMDEAARTGRADDSRWMRRQDGHHFYALGAMTRLCDDEGRLIGFLKTLRDHTAHRQAAVEREHLLREASQARAWAENQSAALTAAIDAMAEGVLIGDVTGLHRINAAALDLLGLGTLQDLQAEPAALVARLRLREERHGRLLAPAELPFGGGDSDRTQVRELWGTRVSDGVDVFLRCAAAPVRSGGRTVGTVVVLSDLSHRQRPPQEDPGAAQAGFLAAVSHELRTPLSAMLGWSQVLEHGPVDDAALKQGLGAIARNARLQMQLIDDLQDLNRIERGELRLDLQQIDFGGVLASAVENALAAAQAQRITLHTAFGAQRLGMVADGPRLLQVLDKLLGNAIKFTPPGGHVSLGLSREGGWARLVVADSGQGIEPAFMPQLFQRFRQQDTGTTRRHGGMGIGLLIVRHLVELHGGSVQAHSAGVGKGTTVTLRLPCVAEGVGDEAADGEMDAAPNAAPADAAPAPPAERLDGVSVLLVDDAPDLREVTARLLQNAGARVVAAGGALEALELLQSEQPDVLLSDIGMPEVDGYELMRRVRQLPPERGGAIPAAAFTAYARLADARRALGAGYQLHLTKPVSAAALVAAVASLLAPALPAGPVACPGG